MKAIHVYPVENVFLQDRPAVEHDCTDPFCVESGAFTTEAPETPAPTDSNEQEA